MKKSKNQNGFAAIVSVLILSAIVLIVVSAITYISIGEGQSSLAQTKGEESLYLVEGCAEEVLLKIKNNSNYTGGTILLPEISCNASIVKTGTSYDITISNLASKYTKTILIRITKINTITINYWQEV